MEIEQRYVMSSLYCQGMNLPEVVAEPASVYQEDTFDENRVKYWFHELTLHRSHVSDRPCSSRPLLGETEFNHDCSHKLSPGISDHHCAERTQDYPSFQKYATISSVFLSSE
jgi:hypothetical protein